MTSEDGYLGSPYSVESLKVLNDKLNADVVEQVNVSQQLVLMTNFALETDEFLFKKCSQERISEIASWRWVLSDLVKRLEEVIASLKYEHKALRVVIQRIKREIDEFSREGTRPGVLRPLSDSVEDAIKQEFNFLRKQKQMFERMIPDLEKQTASLEKTKKRIEDDVLNKDQAITVEESCVNMGMDTARKLGCKKNCKKKCSPIHRWENRCMSLKNTGLRALGNALVTRQQLRGARVELSAVAQAYAGRVDSALRRRLHANQVKVQELCWQREEAIRDYKSLDEELKTAEQSLLDNMEKERLVAARLTDRLHRPAGELTKDDVDRKLKDKLARLKRFMKELRSNITRINSLQDHLSAVITQIDCCGEDIVHVVRIDEERIQSRLGSSPSPSGGPTSYCAPASVQDSQPAEQNSGSPSILTKSPVTLAAHTSSRSADSSLETIREENEETDYDYLSRNDD